MAEKPNRSATAWGKPGKGANRGGSGRGRDEREETRPATEARAQPRTGGSETGGNREPQALNRGLRGTEPVGRACLEGRLSKPVSGRGEMAGPASAGLRGGRPGGGAGALGSAGGALGGRAHSSPRSSQPYGDDPHGGAAVERGPGTAPPPAARSLARNNPVRAGGLPAWAPGRSGAAGGVPAPEPIRAARKRRT